MESSKLDSGNKRLPKQYFRVTIIYSDDGTSGRIFTNRDKAEKYAARQKKSPVVKKTTIKPFTRDHYEWHKSPMNRPGERSTLSKSDKGSVTRKKRFDVAALPGELISAIAEHTDSRAEEISNMVSSCVLCQRHAVFPIVGLKDAGIGSGQLKMSTVWNM